MSSSGSVFAQCSSIICNVTINVYRKCCSIDVYTYHHTRNILSPNVLREKRLRRSLHQTLAPSCAVSAADRVHHGSACIVTSKHPLPTEIETRRSDRSTHPVHTCCVMPYFDADRIHHLQYTSLNVSTN